MKTPALFGGIAALLLVLISACPVTPRSVPVDSGFDETGEETVEAPQLFVSGDSNDETLLFISSSAYIRPHGMTLWSLGSEEDHGQPAGGVKAVVTKASGFDAAGYGIIFRQGESAFGESFLTLMINTLGEYIVGKVVEDSFIPFIPWSESRSLVRGYNQRNTLEVRFGEGYEVFLNGVAHLTFHDDDEPVLPAGRGGWIAVIAPGEDFPQSPVHIVFREVPQ